HSPPVSTLMYACLLELQARFDAGEEVAGEEGKSLGKTICRVMFPDKARLRWLLPDCEDNQNCPCHRDCSRREPRSRFALRVLFARLAWFETSFDPLQLPIECDHLRS